MNLQELINCIYTNNIPQLIEKKSEGLDFTVVDPYDNRNLLISYSTYGYSERYSQKEMVEFLVECGLNVNHRTNKRSNEVSALHKAVDNNHLKVIETLIQLGADIEICDADGNTPLSNAVFQFRGNEDSLGMIQYLLNHGASLNSKNKYGVSSKDIINQIGGGIDNGFNNKSWDLRHLIR